MAFCQTVELSACLTYKPATPFQSTPPLLLSVCGYVDSVKHIFGLWHLLGNCLEIWLSVRQLSCLLVRQLSLYASLCTFLFKLSAVNVSDSLACKQTKRA